MARVTAISSLGWANYTLYEAIPRMAARGFTRVEIASFFCYCFHFNFGNPVPAELRKMLDSHGLTPVCLNYCPDFYDAWREGDAERFVADMTRKLDQLGDVGIPMMTMPFGMRNDRPDQEKQLATAVRVFDRLGNAAARRGVRMVIEAPHLYTITYNPEQVLWVMDRLSSDNVGVLVDSSHWGIIGYDVDAYFAALGKRLWHVHLRDSTGPDTADCKQQLELTPGKGIVDFVKFAAALDRVGYAGEVSTEFEYRNMTFDAIEQEHFQGLAHLRRCGWEIPAGVAYAEDASCIRR